MSETPIKCNRCNDYKHISLFKNGRLKQGVHILAKACQPCRDKQNARHDSNAQVERRKRQKETAAQYNKLINWPLAS